jgi:hypothetical protein
MSTTIPVIPDVIAGITHEQVKAYFAELKTIAGFGIGYTPSSGKTPKFTSYEQVGTDIIVEIGDSAQEAISLHIQRRPPTGLALAQKKLLEAQALLAIEQQKAAQQ